MKNKNTLLIKWILGILLLLVPAIFWTNQMTINWLSSEGQSVSSQNPFFKFWAGLFGLHNPNQNTAMSFQGHVPASGNLSQNTISSKSATNGQAVHGNIPNAGQGSNSAQNGKNPGENADQNSGDNAGNNGANNSGNNPQDNSGNNPDNNNPNNNNPNNNNPNNNNPDNNNPDNNNPNNNNPDNNNPINNNPDNGNPSNNNPDNNNPVTNPTGGPGNHPGGGGTTGGPGGHPGNGPDNGNTYSGCVIGCYPGCIPGCDAACNPPDCLLAGVNQGDLPTINPLPSDLTALQLIALQNQQNATLAAVLAQRQALTDPVMQEAQANKYQTINPDNIPAPSSNPAPSDIVQKLRSNQISLH